MMETSTMYGHVRNNSWTAFATLLMLVLAAAPGCSRGAVIAASLQGDVTMDTSALRVELERVNARELDAIQRGDARAAAAFFAEDALLLPPDGRILSGRAAIEAYWAAGAGSVISDVRTRTVAVGGGATVAFMSGEYSLVATTRSVATRVEGTMLVVFRRKGDAWEIIQDIWTVRPTG